MRMHSSVWSGALFQTRRRDRGLRYRFRYDIDGHAVILKRCALRSERTYRE